MGILLAPPLSAQVPVQVIRLSRSKTRNTHRAVGFDDGFHLLLDALGDTLPVFTAESGADNNTLIALDTVDGRTEVAAVPVGRGKEADIEAADEVEVEGAANTGAGVDLPAAVDLWATDLGSASISAAGAVPGSARDSEAAAVLGVARDLGAAARDSGVARDSEPVLISAAGADSGAARDSAVVMDLVTAAGG